MRRKFLIGVASASALSIASAALASDVTPTPAASSALVPFPDAASSPMALAKFKGQPIALVADEDDAALHIFDVGGAVGTSPREVSVTKLPGKPGHVAIAPDGRVFVAIREKGSVSVLEPAPSSVDLKSLLLVERASIATGGEPVGVGVSPSSSALFVTSGWSGEVLVHSLSAPYAQSQRFEVSREPRTIAVSPEGNAFVSHGVGGMLSVLTYAKDLKTFSAKELDLKGRVGPETTRVLNAPDGSIARGRLGFSVSGGEVGFSVDRPATQGYALAIHEGRVYAPETFVDPEKPVTYYGSDTQSFGILMVDTKTATVVESSRELALSATAAGPSGSNCYLPRAAAFDAERKRILVGCAGSDVMLDFDSLLSNPAHVLKRRVRTDDAPAAISIDNTRRVAITWSQLGRTVSVVALDKSWSDTTTKPVAVAHASGRSSLDVQLAHGRRLFHSGDGRVAADGRACATCHPDGRDDGIAWKTPDGPRQTAMLAGRVADTAPYGWTRAQPTLKAYITDTITRLQGHGLPDLDMRDLVLYIKSLEAPPRTPTITVPAAQVATVTRGRELFESAAVGCATCHSGAGRTDGVKHDIGSAVSSDKDKSFETPSLRFVARTAPYFHDGRYKSLRDLLLSESGKMGNVKQLSDPDRDALVSYLTSL